MADDKIKPVMFQWDGEHMVPEARFERLCNAQYVVGESYPLAPFENRSLKSHNHYFASIQNAWDNLAEHEAKRFFSTEHLRAWALITCGYARERVYTFDSEKDAEQFAMALADAAPLAIIERRGDVVRRLDAESQSMQAMKAARFQESKDKVLDLIATLARTTRRELQRESGREIPPNNRERLTPPHKQLTYTPRDDERDR